MTVGATARAEEILGTLRSLANADNVVGMARFGISVEGTLGVSVTTVRGLARELRREAGRDGGVWRHELASALWDSGVHEARILSSIIDEPALVTIEQMERHIADLDSWDLCDGLMNNLYRRTPYAYDKALEWAERDEEYVKRAGFVLMASLAVHEKSWPDERISALRQIGKRDAVLLPPARELAERLSASTNPTARWIGKDAARELRSRVTGLSG
jgi:3-methyladenine DNA glycosylase AlkD